MRNHVPKLLVLLILAASALLAFSDDKKIIYNDGTMPYDVNDYDPHDFLNIHDNVTAERQRQRLINIINMPTHLTPTLLDCDTSRNESIDCHYGNITQLDLTYHGFVYHAHLIKPEQPNGILLLFHGGHEGAVTIKHKSTINRFLQHGYTVLAFSMPLEAPNRHKLKSFIGHNDIFMHKESPWQYFFVQISAALNKYAADYANIYMTGFSGGGWTTMLYAAMDQRIKKSYVIAGGWPIYLRAKSPAHMGDREQHDMSLYGQVSYLDMFALARHQLQIFNYADSCCFDQDFAKHYEPAVSGIASKLGHHFSVYTDHTGRQHVITSHALDLILQDMVDQKNNPDLKTLSR